MLHESENNSKKKFEICVILKNCREGREKFATVFQIKYSIDILNIYIFTCVLCRTYDMLLNAYNK